MPTILWAGLLISGPDWEPHTNYAVCVDGARITAVGRRNELVARYPDARQFGDERLLLMPGLVNSHDHGRGQSALASGYSDDLLEAWLPALQTVTGADPYLLSLYESLRLLRAGVTSTTHNHIAQTPERMLAECEQAIQGYRAAGIRVAIQPTYADQSVPVYGAPEPFLDSLPAGVRLRLQQLRRPSPHSMVDYLAICSHLYEKYHDRSTHRVHVQAGPLAGPWCSDDLFLAACDWAQARRTRVHSALLTTRYQHLYAQRRWGRSYIRHLAEIGGLSPALTLAHMVWADAEDYALLGARGVGVVHCPSSNLRLHSGALALPALLAAGLPLGIGLDGQGLDDDQDLLRELRLAWTLANGPGAHAPTVAPPALLHMGTAGGAAVTFGPEVPLGVVAPGALADLVLLDWHAIRDLWASPHVAIDQLLLRRAARQHVRDVMVNGEWVVRDGRATRVDEPQVRAALLAQLERKESRSAEQLALARQLAPYLRRYYATWEAEAARATAG